MYDRLGKLYVRWFPISLFTAITYRWALSGCFLLICPSLTAQTDRTGRVTEVSWEADSVGAESASIRVTPKEKVFRWGFGGFWVAGQIGVPSAPFRRAIRNSLGNLGYGGSLGVMLNPFSHKKASPWYLGADVGYLNYGVDKMQAGNVFVKTSANIYTLNGLLRWSPKRPSRVHPFVDGLMGIKVFNSRSVVDVDALTTLINNPDPVQLHAVNSTVFNYGLGAGLITTKFFFVRVLYLWGDPASYVVRGSVKADAGLNFTYQTAWTRTHMWAIQIGFGAQ